jgi:hypothetical protein
MDIMELIKQLVIIAVAVLGSNGLWAWIQSKSTAKSARDRMLLGLGHAEIFRLCEKYIRRGAITVNELEDLDKYLFKPYSELGGNGTASAMVEKCKKLDIISDAEAIRRDAND